MATANIGFEETLWKTADKLRGSMDSGEYKHVVLGLIFVKYISDKFETKYNELLEEGEGFEEDRDEYTFENIFWVPKEARWHYIRDNAKDPKIGQIIDDAMILIEKENPTLKGVLDKRYARPELDKRRLGELIDLISTIKLHQNGEKDLLGRVYEYFLGQFASSEGKGGGEFYTPTSVVKTLVEMIEPYEGRIYDPACGSGGMFIQSEKFVEEHQGKVENLSIYGQELNSTTWKLCRMNLAIRGLDGNIGPHHADTFHDDLHKTLKADYILANPPFNISDWGGDKLTEDVRWKYGTPPEGNANYAWLQHMIYHLAPNGCAGIVLANGALSSNTSSEGEIRKNLVEGKLVDAIVALPDKLFYSTGIPVSLWILNRNKKDNPKFRSREDEILFIDARNLGEMIDRRHRELKDEDIKKIAETYHNYRNLGNGEGVSNGELRIESGECGKYEDVKGFCKAAILDEVRENEYVLTPGRYVGIDSAYNQIQTYKQDIPSLFNYNAFCILSDGINAKAGTITSNEERFMNWRSIDGIDVASLDVPQYEVMLRGMLQKERILDIVENFLLFQESTKAEYDVDGNKIGDKKSIIKILAGYHQYFAVKKAVEKTKIATSEQGDKKIGVIWHTQGSGKSFSMVFYAAQLVKELNNPTLVILTDRNDLDDQLFGTFSKSADILRQTPKQAHVRKLTDDQKKAQAKENSKEVNGLFDLLNERESGGIIFTTIQKFKPEEGEMPALTSRRNVIIIADEAVILRLS